MSELLKKIEAAEKLAADRADQIESFKAEIEAAKADAAKKNDQIAGLTADKATAEQMAEKLTQELTQMKDALDSARAEVETLKAKLAITPVDDLGKGDKTAVPVGGEAAGGKVDHMAVYKSLRGNPKAQEKYRAEHAAELGC